MMEWFYIILTETAQLKTHFSQEPIKLKIKQKYPLKAVILSYISLLYTIVQFFTFSGLICKKNTKTGCRELFKFNLGHQKMKIAIL